MSVTVKYARRIFVVLAMAAALYGFSRLSSLSFFDVDTEIVSRIPSPDSRFDAVLLTKDAGATTLTAYQVAVVRKGDLPDDEKVVFIADHVGFGDVKLRWEGRSLRIAYPALASVFRRKLNLRLGDSEVLVKYEGHK